MNGPILHQPEPEQPREITRVCTSCCQGRDPSCEGPTTCAERGWGEVDRLRRHVRHLHRLNGWSKSKGWWCSCGKAIQPGWLKIDGVQPWTPEGRKHAKVMHAEHVAEVLRGTNA